MSGHTHSEETRSKISDTHKEIYHSGRFKTGEENPMFGKTGENHHMFGKNHSEETRKKICDTMVDKEKPLGSGRSSQAIEVFDNKNNQKTNFESIREASSTLNIPVQTISSYFKNNQVKPYKGQYIFKKI
jgi:group I intron endonuclease